MTELDILLPFGLPPAELAGDLLKEMNVPALAMLVSRARSEAGRHEVLQDFRRALPHETWIAHRFGLEDDAAKNVSPPVAAALMSTMHLPPETGAWFVLQPVHIHVARDHLVLTDTRQLALPEDESRILFDIAAPLFAESGKRLLYGNASTWFVESEDWRELETSSPDAASGHNIDIWMPKGPGERDWRKVQNEVQMHWFNHPLNESREARRLKPVNSVWLWGGPAVTRETRSEYAKAFNLSGWMQAFRACVPAHADAADAGAMLPALGQRNMLLLDSLLEPALSNDWARWLDGMKQLEENWFAPLLHALQSGKLDQVSLIATHDSRISRYAATRASLRKFWVKPSLATLCP
ncbi:hypothetical protein [Noviherbaspirillum sp.]|uniref:hypothetical protein n=1 Tax=Noviherbaspirillum sp. TaxID=1926288 RepID=UPI002D36707D|nr:hypothetical protein [Noviherbaspirillum sp.]HZW21792.1 hypothetical protein [Noviherbaspirillum sp.]